MAEKPETNPWDFPSKNSSPNKKLEWEYIQLGEIGMGGPLSGGGILHPLGALPVNQRFGGPPIWSPNSHLLVVPQWIGKGQSIAIFDFVEKLQTRSEPYYWVLHIRTFDGNRLEAVDSPAHEPYAFAVSLEEFEWQPIIFDRQSP